MAIVRYRTEYFKRVCCTVSSFSVQFSRSLKNSISNVIYYISVIKLNFMLFTKSRIYGIINQEAGNVYKESITKEKKLYQIGKGDLL